MSLVNEKKMEDMEDDPMPVIGVLSAKQHELETLSAKDPKPIFRYVAPETDANPAALTVGGTMDIDFEIAPMTPVNLYRCQLEGKLAVTAQDATANSYLWVLNNWADIQQLQFYDKEQPSFKPVDIQDLDKWMRICQTYLISEDEYKDRLSHDSLRLNKNADLNPFPVSVLNSDYLSPGDRKEPVWLERSDLATAHTRRFIYRLGDVKESLFALDKYLMFPGTMVLRFKVNVTNLAWRGLSAVSPQQGAAAVDADTTYTYTGLRLKMCMEGDMDTVDKMKSQLRSGGYQFVYPQLHQYRKVPSAAAEHEVFWKLQPAMGTFCRKLIYAPFHATQSLNTYHSMNILSDANTEADSDTAIENYNTYLDHKELQNAQILYTQLKNDTSPNLENNAFQENQSFVKHSAFVDDKKKHLANFVHCDDWTNGRDELALQGVALTMARDVSIKVRDVTAFAATNRTAATTQVKDYKVYACTARYIHFSSPAPDGSATLVS